MASAKLRRLQEIIDKLASGVWSKWRHIDSREEFVQECWLNCITKSFRRIEPDRNAFSYLTTCFVNVGNNLRFDHLREGQGEREYRSEYISEQRYMTHDPDPE